MEPNRPWSKEAELRDHEQLKGRKLATPQIVEAKIPNIAHSCQNAVNILRYDILNKGVCQLSCLETLQSCQNPGWSGVLGPEITRITRITRLISLS
jgi:hypothetical protein